MRPCGRKSTRFEFFSINRQALPLILLSLLAQPLMATTIVAPSDEELIARSSVIVTGTVVSSQTIERTGQLYTDTVVKVGSVIHGSADSTVTVRHAGGRTASRARVVFGTPEYAGGERVLLFLDETEDGVYTTIDLFLGKFSERRTADGGRIWQRATDASGTTLLDSRLQSTHAKGNVERDAASFESFIRNRAAGANASADYFLVDPDLEASESVSFATLAEADIHRWFRFDDGRDVVWNSVGEQNGFDQGGLPELGKALNVWTSYSGARIRFVAGGPVNKTVPASAQNGLNEILFNDPFGEIFGRWNGQSGVLAQAEYHAVKVNRAWSAPFDAGQSHPAKTFPEVWEIVEGNIVIQDGVSPYYRIGDVMLTQIIAHELGHTLGLAHSSDSSALMSSTIDGSGAYLRADDQLAVRWLYPLTSSSTPSPSPAPELIPVTVDFSVSKEFAEVAEMLHLVDLTKGSPISWEWSFGDGTKSKEKNPAHQYQAPGTYLVTLSASNGSFTSSRTRSVVVSPEQLVHSLIPVATQTAGAGGTQWRTELDLFNTGTDTATLTLVYLPQQGGQSLSRTIALGAGDSISYGNALPELFGIDAGLGAIELSANAVAGSDTIRISSRTFTGADEGTYGQSVPHLSSPKAVNYITGIESNASFRTNIGLVNSSINPVSASITLFAADGTSIGSAQVVIEGRTFQQTPLTSLIPAVNGTSAGSLSARIEADRDEVLYSYASVVDNQSNDPFLVPGSPSSARELIIPGAAHTAGSGGTFWKTDISLFNPAPAAITLSIGMLGESETRSLTLAPGFTASIRDIVQWLGSARGQGALRITADGSNGAVVSTRTYTSRQNDSATYGQWIQESDPATWTATVSVTGVRSDSRYRTNAGIVNAAEAGTDVELELQTGGTTVSSTRIRIEGKSQSQFALGVLFPGAELTAGATITARSVDGAPIAIYASVVDNLSGDPTFLSGR